MPRKTTITEESLQAKRDRLCERMVLGVRRANKRGAALAGELKYLSEITDEFETADKALSKFRNSTSVRQRPVSKSRFGR